MTHTRTRRLTRLAALALSMLMLAAACGGGADDSSSNDDGASEATGEDGTTETTADGADQSEGEDDARDRTLVVAATGTPGSLDGDIFTPNMQATVVQAYDPLLGYEIIESDAEQANGAREINPEVLEGRLAESWEVSEDGLTTTLTLREGVMSYAGNELTSADVVWSWDKSIAQERTGNFIRNAANVESIEAIDNSTVEFTTSSPSPILLRALTLYVPSIYDSVEAEAHATEEDPFATEWLAQNTAGFGPYHLETLESGTEAAFVRNPNYYGDEPYFERVLYRAVPDASNRVSLLQAGQVGYMENPAFRQVAELREDPSAKVQSVVGNQQARILMNPNFEPFESREVRQAINYAMDSEAMLDLVFEGLATQATSPVPPTFACHNAEYWVYERDLDRARELLAEAGYEDGIEIELEYSGVWWWEEPMAIQAQSQLAEAGIDVTLSRIPDDEMTSRAALGERNLPFFTFYEQAIVPDPGYALFLNSHPEGASDRNDYGSSNPEFVALVEEGNTTTDEEARCELFDEAQRMHVEDASWVYGAMMGTHLAQAPDMEGWVWWADNNPRWSDLRRG